MCLSMFVYVAPMSTSRVTDRCGVGVGRRETGGKSRGYLTPTGACCVCLLSDSTQAVVTCATLSQL